MQPKIVTLASTKTSLIMVSSGLSISTLNRIDDPSFTATDSAGKKLCTGSRDNFVHLWDVETGDCIKQSGKTRNLVTHICWAHGQPAVAQTSEDKSVRYNTLTTGNS